MTNVSQNPETVRTALDSMGHVRQAIALSAKPALSLDEASSLVQFSDKNMAADATVMLLSAKDDGSRLTLVLFSAKNNLTQMPNLEQIRTLQVKRGTHGTTTQR